MSRFDDLLSEEPASKQHTENILARATEGLEKNRKLARASRRRSLWGIFGLGLTAAFGFILWNLRVAEEESELSLAAFTEVEVDDVDLLAAGDEGFVEFLETLEDEDWEES